MFRVWKESTLLFVLQLIVGGSVFAETGDAPGSAALVCVLTFMVLSGLLGTVISEEMHMVSLAACGGVLAVFMATLNSGIGVAASLACTLTLAYVTAIVGSRGTRETWPLILIALLPLGVGTLFGGTILLWRRLLASPKIPLC